ncbi:hypothetical protein FEM03_19855 [Phragmitibacter flavus]|uniref:Methane oxygenase PmoA n=1 Tax=Phragmitibacter flavus TaxID=2576071 RepID=A0A5R8KBI7_9BACT|nr:PmoA family protein [Phragmitibacter flavus]TLD68919.1 hypothetical protein FEM03_19855 [Phragmitibacter flavus]
MKQQALFLTTILALGISAFGNETPKGFSIEELPGDGVRVLHQGKPFAEYIVNQGNKPFLWPVYGPTGKSMTRDYPMKEVEGEDKDHVHQRGISFGHEGVGGFDSWAEKATFEGGINDPKRGETNRKRLAAVGYIKHREYTKLAADEHHASVSSICDYTDAEGKKLMSEERHLVFRVIDGNRIIDFNQDLIASSGDVKLDDKKDAGLYIRVPTSMSVDTKKGGRIINDAGQVDNDAWAQPAKWVAYYGPVQDEVVGVTILNHPSSFRHPTRWHVRSYGLFTANPFASQQYDKSLPDAGLTLKSSEKIKLRHRMIFHKGDEKEAKIAEAYETYAKKEL